MHRREHRPSRVHRECASPRSIDGAGPRATAGGPIFPAELDASLIRARGTCLSRARFAVTDPACHDASHVPAPPRKPRLHPLRAPAQAPPPAEEPSELVQGLRAGLAVFLRRPDDIVRVVHASTVRRDVTELARWAARRGVPCAEMPERELDRFAE